MSRTGLLLAAAIALIAAFVACIGSAFERNKKR
jgi:hypothetical protein